MLFLFWFYVTFFYCGLHELRSRSQPNAITHDRTKLFGIAVAMKTCISRSLLKSCLKSMLLLTLCRYSWYPDDAGDMSSSSARLLELQTPLVI
ncbi:hypothetical protein F5Y19DRAFT_407059 [Xylariaceae sp. FL1651]|nr:hypothetical protein F5Y19DRAFT_407059 [Xylariaceae sp. FL1651]